MERKIIIIISLIGLALLMLSQPQIKSVDCDGCWELYYAVKDAGYSRNEIKDGLRVYDCDECPGFSFLYGDSGSSSDWDDSDYDEGDSGSDGSEDVNPWIGGCCCLFLIIIGAIVLFGKAL